MTIFPYAKSVSLSTQKNPFLSNYHLGVSLSILDISNGILEPLYTTSDSGLISSIRLPVALPGNGTLNNLE